MTGIWNACVQAACDAFDISRTEAKLFVIGLFAWMGLMILETWFIWVGLIVTFVTVLAILLILEYSLRAWYTVRDGFRPRAPTTAVSSPDPADVPDRPSKPCADAQGRIEKDNLRGYDVNAMAQQILRKACIRKIWSPRPSRLSFPAISRAMPRLAEVGRMLKVMLTR